MSGLMLHITISSVQGWPMYSDRRLPDGISFSLFLRGCPYFVRMP